MVFISIKNLLEVPPHMKNMRYDDIQHEMITPVIEPSSASSAYDPRDFHIIPVFRALKPFSVPLKWHTFARLECKGRLLQYLLLVAVDRIIYTGPHAAPGYWTDGHCPNALRRHLGGHPSKSSQGPDSGSNVAGGRANVFFVLVYDPATKGSLRRGKANRTHVFSDSEKRR